MRILVTNDDGIESTGLAALAEAMSQFGEVAVMAPDGNRSAAAHSITLERPLRIKRIKKNWHAVDGTPADCVHLALNGFCRDKRPELVVSGINKGGNMGQDITYSGTVMAALEATMIGIPSFAISVDARANFNFAAAAKVSQTIARFIIESGLPEGTLLNVNVPNVSAEELQGIKATIQGRRVYGDEVEVNTDPRGKKYYRIAGQELGFVELEGSDILAVRRGYASVTPIHFQLTNFQFLESLQKKKW